MKLRNLALHRYRQFVDEKLAVDPRVTVIVGRNDTGKTGLLDRFFDQYVMGRASYGTDAPLSQAKEEGNAVAFSVTWDVAPGDEARYALAEAFGRPDIREIEVDFDARRPRLGWWAFRADGVATPTCEDQQKKGWPVLWPLFSSGRLFPPPHFISIGDQRLIPFRFETRFFELSNPDGEVLPHRRLITLEALLLQLAGLRADTRAQWGRGTEEPWDTPMLGRAPSFKPGEIQARLATVAERLTGVLRQWWDEPANLTFRLRLVTDNEASYRRNSHLVEWSITDEGGARRHGAGLTWFVAFAVELLHLEDQAEPRLLLIDEPATPLHPGMQKRVARLLQALAPRHQTLYSTHSPFLIDWNFPQQIRLFEHDYLGKRTKINNKPYADAEGVWDPLRRSIGVTLGDVTGLSFDNVLVEGVTDQILLANASAVLAAQGRVSLDLTKVSIVPYSEEQSLQRLLATIGKRGYRAVVLTDSDEQGKKVVAHCAKASVPCVELRGYTPSPEARIAAIEDVVGIDAYVPYVNEFYSRFDWFIAFDPADVRKELSGGSETRTLGKYVQDQFGARFGKGFDKVGVAVEVASRIAALPSDVLERMERLFAEIQRKLC